MSKFTLKTAFKKTSTPFLDAIRAMVDHARENGIRLDFCEVSRPQWDKMKEEMGAHLHFDWHSKGETWVDGIQVICKEVSEEVRDLPVEVVWDGNNLDEVYQALSIAFIVESITFKGGDKLVIKLQRFPYDSLGPNREIVRADRGDTITVRRS